MSETLSRPSTPPQASRDVLDVADRQAFAGSPEPSGRGRPDKQRDSAKDESKDQDTDTDHDADKKSPSLRERIRAHPLITALIAAVLLALIVGAIAYWLYARQFESTDDAFIDARTVTISAQQAGAVIDVLVTDNQAVDAGAVLAHIDPRDYSATLAQANAQVEQATASIANLDAQIDAQQARIDQARRDVAQAAAATRFAEDDNARYQDLVVRGAGTAQRAQQAQSDLEQRRAAQAASEAAQAAVEKQIPVLQTQRDVAMAQRDQAVATQQAAQTNLGRTTLVAPVAGFATRVTAAKGAYVAPGQALMMFVPKQVWITANFKETQLALMRPGQTVDVRVDAFPDHVFKGRVDSIQAGSGTAFSLLPAENATGNYVKVVQRIPVKITFEDADLPHLGPGMSVVPTVTVR